MNKTNCIHVGLLLGRQGKAWLHMEPALFTQDRMGSSSVCLLLLLVCVCAARNLQDLVTRLVHTRTI